MLIERQNDWYFAMLSTRGVFQLLFFLFLHWNTLRVLSRIVSLKQFYWVPSTCVSVKRWENDQNIYSQSIGLSGTCFRIEWLHLLALLKIMVWLFWTIIITVRQVWWMWSKGWMIQVRLCWLMFTQMIMLWKFVSLLTPRQGILLFQP